jgi:Protein of unknown function (DUF2971)
MRPQEDIDREAQLERIFSPFATKQMREFYLKQPNPDEARFVHYTSAEAALRIIQNKRIWMRNVTSMSDYSEVQHGHLIHSNLLNDPDIRNPLVTVLDNCAPGAADEAFKHFDKWWEDIRLNSFVTSISEHDQTENTHGRLSMWRGFGGHSARVALVFKVSSSLLRAGVFNLMFSPVAYLTDKELRAQYMEVINEIQKAETFLKSVGKEQVRQSVYSMLVANVTCLKHEGFKEEREWRLIYGPQRWPSKYIEKSTEVVAGIPQIVYKIPLDRNKDRELAEFDLARILDRVIIGPTQFSWSLYEAFAVALKDIGVPDSGKHVVNSQIPIRT